MLAEAGRSTPSLARLRALPPALARLAVQRLADDAPGPALGSATARPRSSALADPGALDLGGGLRAEDHRGLPGVREPTADAMQDRARLAAPFVLRDEAIGEILVQADELQHRVGELGAEITRDYEGRDLLLVGVLKGAVFFLADLMRHIEVPCEVDFMAVASYGSPTESSGVVRILKDLDAAIEGRDVLIVEDIVDSGLTLHYLLRNLRARARPRSRSVPC